VHKVEVTIKDDKPLGALLGHRGIETRNLAGVVTYYDQGLNPYSQGLGCNPRLSQFVLISFESFPREDSHALELGKDLFEKL
jgi:hypothetical protein